MRHHDRSVQRVASQKGFTILEILVVLTVLAILVGIAIPRMKGLQTQANLAKAKFELKTVETAVLSYHLNSSSYPANIGVALTSARPQILSQELPDPLSPTGDPYHYLLSNNNRYYVLWSDGLPGDQIPTAISNAGAISY